MNLKDKNETVLKELLPAASKKLKSARFQVVAAGDEKKGDDVDDASNMTHQMTHQGSHQFTQYAKSFRHYLTRDVLPSESNYRNLLSFSRNSAHNKRPTIQELRDEEIMLNNKEKSDKQKEEDVEGKKNRKSYQIWMDRRSLRMRRLQNENYSHFKLRHCTVASFPKL